MKNKISLTLFFAVFIIAAATYPDVCKGADYIVNVKDYGAVGDGITDDSIAIIDAIAASGSGTKPRVVFFPVGNYKITRTIFLGMFSSSGNGQGLFLWGGLARFWGGGIAYAKCGSHLIGETDDNGNNSQITYSGTTSLPMFVITGGRDHKIEKLQLNGIDTSNPSNVRASEGVFLTAGTWGFTLEQSVIKNCKRGFRAGNLTHWPEDPVVFTDYETQTGYPITTGGWMVEGIMFINSRIYSCDICISQETAQTIHFLLLNTSLYSDSPSGYGVFLKGGRMTFFDCTFGGNSICDIYNSSSCSTSYIKVFGGRSENLNDMFFIKDRVSGEGAGAVFGIHDFSGRDKSIRMKGAGRLVIDGGSFKNINLGYNYNTADSAIQLLDIRNTKITGRVGAIDTTGAEKTVLCAENTIFSGTGTTPWNTYFNTHRVNSIVNCSFTGDNFTDSVNRLNHQGIGMFSTEVDGDSQFSFGADTSNTNVLYGSQTGVDILKGAYRKGGGLFAAETDGSMFRQGEDFLSFKTFVGDTVDTTIDSWTERFGVQSNGGIWVVKVNGHSVGWNSSAPSSGTWSRGDVIYNSNVGSSGTYAWIYTGSIWRNL